MTLFFAFEVVIYDANLRASGHNLLSSFALAKAHLTALISAIVLSADPVEAADIRVIPTGTSVEMVVVHGEIVSGDADRFISLIRSIEVGAVLLESPGGSLIDGIRIGRAIREAGYSTGVAPDTACASACALAWLAGSTRYMDPSALVGFHAAYQETGGVGSVSGVGNALVGAYLNELGFGLEAIIFVTSAAPDEMNWLNALQARRAGIDVVLLTSDGAEVKVERGAPLRLPSGFRWIVLESSLSPGTLTTARIADQVVRTRSGYFAAVIGPYESELAEQIISTGSFIPEDAYLSSGIGFLFSLE